MTVVQAIGVLIVRVYAIYVIINSIANLAVYGYTAIDPVEGWDIDFLVRTLIYHSAILLTGILIFALSRPLARFLTPSETGARGEANLSTEALISGGTFLIGVFLLAMNLPEILSPIAQEALYLMRNLDKSAGSGYGFFGQGEWLNVFVILIGLWLVLRPAHLASLFSWLRTAGQVPSEAKENESRHE